MRCRPPKRGFFVADILPTKRGVFGYGWTNGWTKNDKKEAIEIGLPLIIRLKQAKI
ncbi:MAG: hypothetical protein LBG19_00700 [Prevotellaceae bacterium]|nr:hypothetical protein [Prevotellaceae bacterium]